MAGLRAERGEVGGDWKWFGLGVEVAFEVARAQAGVRRVEVK